MVAELTPSAQGDLRFEEHYGGDVQSVDTASDLCGLALPTSQYRLAHTYASGSLATSRYTNADGTGVGFLSADFTIDLNTGLVASSQDPAGLETAFEYDEMGRLEWEKPQSGHGAWTEYDYTRATSATAPAKVKILHRANGSEAGTILSQEEVRFDGFGRVWKERRLMPALSWVMRETLYDGMGQKSQVSEWADEDAEPFVQHWTYFLDYDPYGRPQTIRPPDGSAHDVTMTYVGDATVRRKVKIGTSRTEGVTSEVESETIERYDRQGRLFRVLEPSASGGSNVTTTYKYDQLPELEGRPCGSPRSSGSKDRREATAETRTRARRSRTGSGRPSLFLLRRERTPQRRRRLRRIRAVGRGEIHPGVLRLQAGQERLDRLGERHGSQGQEAI